VDVKEKKQKKKLSELSRKMSRATLSRERVGQAAQTACLAPSREHLQCTQRDSKIMNAYQTTEQEDKASDVD